MDLLFSSTANYAGAACWKGVIGTPGRNVLPCMSRLGFLPLLPDTLSLFPTAFHTSLAIRHASFVIQAGQNPNPLSNPPLCHDCHADLVQQTDEHVCFHGPVGDQVSDAKALGLE